MSNHLLNSRIAFYKNTLNKNKAVVLLIPTIIGSIIQFLALVSIDYNFTYLKFFSISQIISDSIFFVFALILTLFMDILLVYFFGEKIITFKKNKYHISEFNIIEKEKNHLSIFYQLIMIFNLVCIILYTLLVCFNFNILEDNIIVIIVFLILTTFVILPNLYLYFKGFYSSWRKFYTLSFTFILIGGFYMLSRHFLRETSDMNNNLNFKNTSETIKCKLKVSNIQLLYFNDKYIFYQTELEGIDYIYVYKLENILNN